MSHPLSIDSFWNLPEVKAMRGHMQNEWHRYDVYKHTKKVYALMHEKNPDSKKLLVSAILHDIGKPSTEKISEDEDGIRYVHGHICYQFPDHALEGKKLILSMEDRIFTRHGLGKENIAEIVGKHHLIQSHVKGIRNYAEEPRDMQRKVANLREDLYDKENAVMRNDLVEMFYADSAGKGYPERIELEMLVYHMLKDNLFEPSDVRRLQKTATRMHKRFDFVRY